MPVNHLPDGYHVITPYLICKNAAQAIDYYTRVFGATETVRLGAPGGRVGHAELRIGDAVVMIADEHPEMNIVGPQSLGGTSVSLLMYVKDCDRVFADAVAAGATANRPVKDQFYGDRSGTIIDPFGHMWTIATHMEDVSLEEMNRRMANMQQA